MLRWLNRWLPAFVLVLVGLFWGAFARMDALEDRSALAAATHSPPPLLSGLVFAPDGFRPLTSYREGAANDRAGMRLVFIMSDTCAACIRAVPMWTELLGRVNPQSATVSLFTVDGEQLLSRLASVARARGVEFDSYFIDSRDAYTYATGVTSSPRLLVVNSENRIQYVSTDISPTIASEILNIVNR